MIRTKQQANGKERKAPAREQDQKATKATASIADHLINGNRSAFVTLYNDKGDHVRFCQVFSTTYEGAVYFIMRPLDKIDGIEPDQGVLFKVVDDRALHAVKNKKISKAIFDRYYAKLRDMRGID